MSMASNAGFGPTGATLPVWDTIGRAFTASIRQPRGLLWTVVGIWAVILAALQIMLGLFDPVAMGSNLALNLIVGFVGVIAFVDIAVVWTRYLVLEDVPKRFFDGRLNGRRWAYRLRLLLLIVAAVGFMLSALMLLTLGMGLIVGLVFLVVAFIPVMLLAIYITFGRFGLYFTGVALGDPRMSLDASWRLSADNAVRLTVAVTVVVIAAAVAIATATSIVSSILAAISPFLSVVAAAIVVAVGSVWGYLVQHAVLARAYILLVPEPAPGTLRL